MDEIIDLMESHGRKLELERREKIADTRDMVMLMWNQNMQLMNIISHSIHPDEIELKMPHEYYPELFGEEIKGQEKATKRNNELALHKARMEEYAFRHNRALKERGESSGRNDTGKTSGNHRGANSTVYGCHEESTEPDEPDSE